MKVAINGTIINAIECKEVFDYDSHALVIVIDKSEINSNELEELVFTNTGAIIKEDDSETKTYIGFTKSANILIKEDVYEVSLYETTSSDAKIAELEATVAEKDNEIAELEEFIETDINNAIREGVNAI